MSPPLGSLRIASRARISSMHTSILSQPIGKSADCRRRCSPVAETNGSERLRIFSDAQSEIGSCRLKIVIALITKVSAPVFPRFLSSVQVRQPLLWQRLNPGEMRRSKAMRTAPFRYDCKMERARMNIPKPHPIDAIVGEETDRRGPNHPFRRPNSPASLALHSAGAVVRDGPK